MSITPIPAYKIITDEHSEVLGKAVQEDLDSDATFAAVARVMELAYNDRLWALGAITLSRQSDGTVIHTMEAKES